MVELQVCEHSATSHKQQCGNISVGSLGEMMKGTLGDGEKRTINLQLIYF